MPMILKWTQLALLSTFTSFYYFASLQVRIPMHWVRTVTIAAVGSFVSATLAQSEHPRFQLTLKPNFEPADDYTIEGTVLMDGPFSSNSTLVSIPTIIANAPSAQYPANGIVATDLNGEVELSSYDTDNGPYGLPTRYWVTKRMTDGPVTVNFTAHPQDVDPTSQVGPLFSIRNQTEGLVGSFWALVPVPSPDSGITYNISVTWDIPEEMSAVWTWGVGPGPHALTTTLDRLLQTFFAVGKISAHPEGADKDTSSNFGVFWFDDPPFDTENVSAIVEDMFAYSTDFWQDTSGEPYRVIIRKNEEQGTGGTALLRSFTFGYSGANSTTTLGLKTLLSHEMTHNWPSLTDGTNAEASRYSEGMAEFYSLRLLWRSGNLNTTEFVSEMNDRIAQYYNNPFVNYTDEAAMDVAWETRAAQKIPYGRGLLHFTNMDAQMRALPSNGTTNGTLSLDTLALKFLNQCRGGGACGNPEWFEIVRSYLGEAAVNEWNQVSSGSPLLVPQLGSLGPCFEVASNGTDPEGYMWVAKDGVNVESQECII